MARDVDVVQLLLDDHEDIERMLAASHSGATAADTFAALVRAIVVHEVVEEEIVYPAFRQAGGSDDVMTSRLAEQQAGERLLLDMEHMTPSSAEFLAALHDLEAAVSEHAKKEEQLVFPVLNSMLDPEQRRRLGRAYTAAKEFAPTHPHPHVPDTPPGNWVIGPFVALIDRTRDAARSAMARARG